MKKFSVFLSSAMTGELNRERDSIIILFQTEPTLKELFTLYAIEEHASPKTIEQAFTEKVRNSDLLILLLDKQLRNAVKLEFDSAKKANLKILVYIRNRTDKRDEDLAEFISQDAYQFHCGSFNGSKDLCDKIKNDIISDLTNNYYQAIKELKQEIDYVAVPAVREEPVSSSRYFDHNFIAQVAESDMLKDMDIDQLITLAHTRLDETGNLKEALLIFEVILLKDNNNWQAYNNRGLILEDMGYTEDALFSYRRALELNPYSHATLYNIGNYYRNKFMYNEALNFYLSSIKIEPNKVSALSNITSIYLAIEDYQKALEYAERTHSIQQDEFTIANLCIALVYNNRIEEALKKCEDLSGLNDYRKIRSYIFYISNQFEESLNEINIYFDEENMDYDLAIKKVYCFIYTDRISEAMSWFKEMESVHFITPLDYNNIAWILFQKKVALEDSAKFLQKAVDADPSLLVAWKNLQCVLAELKRFQDGFKVSNRAIEYFPNDIGIIMNRSNFLLMTGNIRECINFTCKEIIRLFGVEMSQEQMEKIFNESLEKHGISDFESFEKLFNKMIELSKELNNS